MTPPLNRIHCIAFRISSALICLLSFLCPVANSAEVVALTAIHDGQINPPGFKIEVVLRLAAAEQVPELSLQVAHLGVMDELIATSNPVRQDSEGKYLQRIPIEPKPASTSPRLVTAEFMVAYRDLLLSMGEHRLAFQLRVTSPVSPPKIATCDVIVLTISDAHRILASAPDATTLTNWQIPAVLQPSPSLLTDPATAATRTIAGGFESRMNDARQREFFAELETAEIHFATNRAANTALAATTRTDYFFSPLPAALSFGHCQVQVLRRIYEREKAVRHSPLSFGELQNYFTVLETHFAAPPEFTAALSNNDLLLYIHGYDNTFEDALLRAAQLHLDLNFPGRTVAFCWPSLGRDVVYENDDPEKGRLAYHDDLKAADASVAALVETLQLLAAPSPLPRRLHVVAHSMGNRVLLAALQQLERSATEPLIDQLILAAPDVGVTELAAAESALAKLARRTSLYCSQKDVALLVSSRIHALLNAALAARAGGVIRCYPRCDAISANLVNSYFAMNGGHCYFAEAPQMVQDLSLLICQQMPPETRPTLLPRSCSSAAERSWELRK